MYKKNHSTIPEIAKDPWFQVWFNTPFYHLLYNKRNFKEAERFILNLISYLNPSKNCKALDLACGAGRHAVILHKMGLDVLGIDLAERSILEAKTNEGIGLRFKVHDMRDIVPGESFDYIFNLFTSFGYFEKLEDDEAVLHACFSQLNPNGIFIFDYLNVTSILPQLPYQGIEIRGNLTFKIEKVYRSKQIIKSIEFNNEGKYYHFEEKVSAYLLEDLTAMLENCGFKIKEVFGNYALEKYCSKSERLIIIAQKNPS